MGRDPDEDEGSIMTNRITVVGNAGKDAELRTVKRQDGSITQVMDISIADSHYRSDQATWFKVSIWGNRAEALAQRLKKGMKLTVMGRLEVSDWISPTNEKRTDLVIHADEIEFTNPQHSQPLGGQQPFQAQAAPQPNQPAPAAPQQPSSSPVGGEPDVDREIPF